MAARVPLATLAGGQVLFAFNGMLLPAAGATAFVGTHGTDVTQPANQVSVFVAETGAPTLGQPLVADVNGILPGWVVAEQILDVRATYSGITATLEANPVGAGDVGAGGGMTNPMTTSQDLIVGGAGGTPGRLGVGSSGQVLGVSAGAVGWSTGMTNPMTTAGDVIVGGTAGAPSRLGAGSDFQSLRSLAGVPVWIGPERVPLFPSNDTSGTTDDTNFAAACTRLDGTSGKPAGGEIVLVSDYNKPFYTKNTAGTYTGNGWAPPGQILASGTGGAVCLQGAGIAVLMPVGAAKTGIYYHGQSVAGQNDYYKGGYVRDVLVDGTLATGASVGFDVGDIIGMHVRGAARNFVTSGAIGVQFINRTFFTEKGTFEIETFNCDTAALVDHAAGGVASHEYNIYDLVVHAVSLDGSGNSRNQKGVVLQDALGRCRLYIRGNMIPTTATSGNPTGNAALLSVLGASGGSMFRCFMIVGAEINSYTGTGSVKPYSIYQDGAGGTITNCSGHINISDGFTQWSANGDEHSFNGPVTFSQQPNWPGSGDFTSITVPAGVTNKNPQAGTTTPATWTNLGLPAFVRVSGSAVTDCQIDGSSLGGSAPWFAFCAPSSKVTIPFTGSTLANVNLSVIRATGGG